MEFQGLEGKKILENSRGGESLDGIPGERKEKHNGKFQKGSKSFDGIPGKQNFCYPQQGEARTISGKAHDGGERTYYSL